MDLYNVKQIGTEYFNYKLVCEKVKASTSLRRNELIGWKIKAKPGVKVFKSESMINGIPVISMEDTFENYQYKDIDISDVDTSHVINMNHCFSNTNLEELDLSGHSFSELETTIQMFKGSQQIKYLDLSKMGYLRSILYITSMCGECAKLERLILPEFSVNNSIAFSFLIHHTPSLRVIDTRYLRIHTSDTKILTSLVNYDISSIKLVIVSNQLYRNAVRLQLEDNMNEITTSNKDIDIDKLYTKLKLIQSNKVTMLYIKS